MSDRSANMQPARRAWRMQWVMQGHLIHGLRLAQIAKALEATPTATLRLLETAAEEGVVERIPGREECWRLSPKLMQLSNAFVQEYEAARRQINELQHRCTREI